MTDKQIIIDGVDVSGCENYGETMAKTHNCTLYDEYLRPCKGTDCYYKQLQRELMLKKEIDKSLYDLIKLDNIPAHIKERVEAIWKQL